MAGRKSTPLNWLDANVAVASKVWEKVIALTPFGMGVPSGNRPVEKSWLETSVKVGIGNFPSRQQKPNIQMQLNCSTNRKAGKGDSLACYFNKAPESEASGFHAKWL